MSKKSRQKFKYFENEKSFYDEIKSIFLEGESATLKLLHVLYSDFDAPLKHKNKTYLTVFPLRFVFCLRGAKYTFTSSGFVLDLIIPLHRGNLSFF